MSAQQALNLEPLAKPLNPMIAWQAPLSHAEAMTPFGIDMQFHGAACRFPGGIQGHVSIGYIQIVIGERDKQRRCIGWHREIQPEGAVDRRREIRTAVCLVTCYGSTDSDDSPRREAQNPNPLRVDGPGDSVLPDHSQGLFSTVFVV